MMEQTTEKKCLLNPVNILVDQWMAAHDLKGVDSDGNKEAFPERRI